MKNALFIKTVTVTVTDPASKLPVEIEIYKDVESGGMFGIDSSFIEQVLDEEKPMVKNPFGKGKLLLVETVNAEVKFFLSPKHKSFEVANYDLASYKGFDFDGFCGSMDEEAMQQRNGLGAYGWKIVNEKAVIAYFAGL